MTAAAERTPELPSTALPSERLRNMIGENGAKMFSLPNGRQLLLCTWEYLHNPPKTDNSEVLRNHQERVETGGESFYVFVGENLRFIQETETSTKGVTECDELAIEKHEISFYPQTEIVATVQCQAGFEVRDVAPSPLTIQGEWWEGEEYDKVINDILNAISKGQEIPIPDASPKPQD